MRTEDVKKVLGVLLIVVSIVAISFSVFSKAEKEQSKITKTSYFTDQAKWVSTQSSERISTGNYPDLTEAANKTLHTVVHIRTTYVQKNTYYDQYYGNNPFFDFFFGNPKRQRPHYQAIGSGVILSSDGYIITNNHVVQDADSIKVTLNDKREYSAKLIGNDPSTDLALIKIEEKNLHYINYGNSDNLMVGEWVLAVGNPFNLTSTVTAGIVSAKARNVNILGGENTLESFIQTDAPVNQGNSGGALVNTKGELVGINAAIASNTGSFTGYAFAIPVNIVKKVVEDILKYGIVQKAYLGIRMQELTGTLAKEKGISSWAGVYVNSVLPKSAAEEAGIKQGDIILKIAGITVNSTSQIFEVMGEHRPGDKVEVIINREGKEIKVNATLKNEAGNLKIINKHDETNETFSALGATFENPEKEELSRLGIRSGLKITKLNKGKLSEAGIKEGFIITAIDHKPVASIEDIRELLGARREGMLIEGVYPNGMRYFYGVGM